VREIKRIFIHVSKSPYGSAEIINHWHTDSKEDGGNGWSHIGYHYIIGNAYPDYNSWNKRKPVPNNDGLVEETLPHGTPGYHAYGNNEDSLAICLIGDADELNRGILTGAQLKKARRLVKSLIARYPGAEVWGHYETGDPKKEFCPTMDMVWFRHYLHTSQAK